MAGIFWRVAAISAVSLWAAACGDKDKDPTPDGGTGSGGTGGKDGGTTGWTAAVGDDGTFVQTFDDATWSARKLAQVNLRAVTCVGNVLGWAAGEAGVVLHSEDSGASWHAQKTSATRALNAIRFAFDEAAAPAGVVAGDGGFVAVSRDAGATWRSVAVDVTVDLHSVALSHALSVVLIVGDSGHVLRSSDFGESFSDTQLEGAGDLRAVAMSHNGRQTLAVDSLGKIWRSSDAGLSFSADFSADQGLTSVTLDSAGSLAIAVGERGGVFVARSPAAWQVSSTVANASLNAALISHDGQRAYVAGDEGTLFSSKTADLDWQGVDTGTQSALRGLEDLDPE